MSIDYSKSIEKIDHLLKMSERKISSTTNLKSKLINMRSLETHFNDKTFILKNCYELEEGLKQELHSSNTIFDELKELSVKFKELVLTNRALENERDILLNDKRLLKAKISDYDEEMVQMRDHRKIYETEIRMKDRVTEKQDFNVQQLNILQNDLRSENSILKTRLHEATTELKESKKMIEELLGPASTGIKDKKAEAEYKARQARLRRVNEIVHKINLSKDLYNYIASQISLDVISSLTLMKCEESFLDRIEKLIFIYEREENRDIMNILEYEKERNEESKYGEQASSSKLSFKESLGGRSKINNDIEAKTMTPKRGSTNKLSLESPNSRVKASMEHFYEGRVTPNDPYGFSLDINQRTDTNKSISSLSNKKLSGFSQTSKKHLNNDYSSPKKHEKVRTLYPDEVSKTPTKMLSIPVPDEIPKKKSQVNVSSNNNKVFELNIPIIEHKSTSDFSTKKLK